MTELEEVTQIIEQEIFLHRGKSYDLPLCKKISCSIICVRGKSYDFSLEYAAAKIVQYYKQKSRDTQETSTNVSVNEYYTIRCN